MKAANAKPSWMVAARGLSGLREPSACLGFCGSKSMFSPSYATTMRWCMVRVGGGVEGGQ